MQREKAKFESNDAREAAKEAAERAKLAEPIDLPLFAAPGASQGCRKRRRKASTGAQDDELLPRLQAARAAHEAASKAADEAEARVDVCCKRQERESAKLEALGPQPAGMGNHIQPELPCERCSRRYWKQGRTGSLWHCKECREKSTASKRW